MADQQEPHLPLSPTGVGLDVSRDMAPQVDPEDLPESVREVVETAGLEAALRIVALRGGTTLHVPRRASAQHWLAPLIGMEALRALVARFHGEEIPIPRCRAAFERMRHRQILSARREGLSQAECARRFATTERNVRLIEARYQAPKRTA